MFSAGRVIAGGSMAVQEVRLHRFTPDEYRRMARIGLVPAQGTELIDGVVVAGTRPVRFSSDEYVRMGTEGILRSDERVELIDGEIVDMTPTGPRHSSSVARLVTLLTAALPGAEIRFQDVLHLRDGFDPQPDAAVYRSRADRYAKSHPTAADALLVVEVADSSLLYDRTTKTEHYAAAGIPEYWLLDLKRSRVVILRNPVGSQYTEVREYRQGDRFTSPALKDAEVEVLALLGPADD
jgi:Uma2 family endonuclease